LIRGVNGEQLVSSAIAGAPAASAAAAKADQAEPGPTARCFGFMMLISSYQGCTLRRPAGPCMFGRQSRRGEMSRFWFQLIILQAIYLNARPRQLG
jgi:hypothetical protein